MLSPGVTLKELIPTIFVDGKDSLLLQKRSLFKTADLKNLRPLGHDVFSPRKVSTKGLQQYGSKIFNITETYPARDDSDWKSLGKYFFGKYKNEPKVNIYQFGCSNGFETYTVATLISGVFKENAKQKFSIKAFDINHKILEEAKVCQEAFDNKENYRKIFSEFLDMKTEIDPKWIPSVVFTHANMIDELKYIDSKTPAIIMCKNMWPYIDSRLYLKIIGELDNVLHQNSCIIIGGFDNRKAFYMNNPLKDKFDPIVKVGETGESYGPIIFEKKQTNPLKE